MPAGASARVLPSAAPGGSGRPSGAVGPARSLASGRPSLRPAHGFADRSRRPAVADRRARALHPGSAVPRGVRRVHRTEYPCPASTASRAKCTKRAKLQVVTWRRARACPGRALDARGNGAAAMRSCRCGAGAVRNRSAAGPTRRRAHRAIRRPPTYARSRSPQRPAARSTKSASTPLKSGCRCTVWPKPGRTARFAASSRSSESQMASKAS